MSEDDEMAIAAQVDQDARCNVCGHSHLSHRFSSSGNFPCADCPEQICTPRDWRANAR